MEGEHKKSSKREPVTICYVAQCAKCLKWWKIDTEEEYMEINRTAREEPYVCQKREGASCEDGGDLEYDSSRPWVIDTPGLPKVPRGFNRRLVVRSDKSTIDVYYITQDGKTRLRSRRETEAFLKANEDYKYASLKDFDFQLPVMMNDTVFGGLSGKTPEPSKENN